MYPEASNKAALGIQKRTDLRIGCRTQLAKHIHETLGIHVMPSQVRLRPEADAEYAWHVENTQIEKLFERHLSGHSVSGLSMLIEGVGRSFWAVHASESRLAVRSSKDQLSTLSSENSALGEELEKANNDLEKCYQEREEMRTEISRLEEKLIVTNASVEMWQKETENWKAIADYYQNRMCQWSDGVNQISRFLQGLKAEIPAMPIGYN